LQPQLLFISFNLWDALDILIVAVLIYQFYKLTRGTAAISIFIGMLLLYFLWLIVRALDMQLLGSILGQFIGVGVLALIIVFQQEIRRFLIYLGTSGILGRQGLMKGLSKLSKGMEQSDGLDIDGVVTSCLSMSKTRTGAIILIEGDTGLDFYANTGDAINAAVSSRMLQTIFFKNSPLHDGAVIIGSNQIIAARCVLPVTENDSFPAHLGMRHRAAMGVSETSDALVIVVSEQTGGISTAKEGKLDTELSPKLLRDAIDAHLTN
jgi:uncharacterized protein (TIGR00159 family)